MRATTEIPEGQNPTRFVNSGPASGCYDSFVGLLDDIGLTWEEFAPGTVITVWTEWPLDDTGLAVAPTATPQPTSVPTPPPIVMPRPFTLDGALSQMPEVYMNAASATEIGEYRELVSRLPLDAQEWVLGMGEFMVDLSLDQNERLLLETVAQKPHPLFYLTHPSIIEGVEAADVDWVRGDTDDRSVAALLQRDLAELARAGWIQPSDEARVILVTQASETSYELRKALYLMINFGHPKQDMFQYPVPSVNTQLFVLSQLLGLGIPAGYELAAVAAGLDYGSMITIGDDAVRRLVPQYAHDIIMYLVETDPAVRRYGANWQVSDDNLEQSISLVWGGPGDYIALDTQDAAALGFTREPNNSWAGLYYVFRNWQFGQEEWDWTFVELASLRGMRTYMIEQGYLQNDRAGLAELLHRFWYDRSLDYQWNPGLTEIDGRAVFNSYITNVDYQWERFERTGRFVGTSGDAYIDTYLKKSINVAGITPTYRIHTTGYFDEASDTWRASAVEFRAGGQWARSVTDEWLGWNKVPWDNFRLDLHASHQGRMYFLTEMPNSVWEDGVPGGYIYRVRD